MSRSRKKNKQKLKNSKNNNILEIKEKVLFGFYFGDHHIQSEECDIEQFLDASEVKEICTIGSPPIFESGFVRAKEHNDIYYSLKLGGRKSIKLDIFEILKDDVDDILYHYARNYNLEIRTIKTVIGEINVLVSTKNIDFHCIINDEESYKYIFNKVKKNLKN